MSKSEFYVDIIAETWDKDSHGLHDYDNTQNPNSNKSNIKKFKLQAQDSFIIGRKKTGNCFLSKTNSFTGMPLISVVNIHENYYVDNSFPKQSMTCYKDFRNCNWIPTIAYNNFSPYRNCHRVLEGDIIRFGRLVFEMRVLCTNPRNPVVSRSSSNLINRLNESFERLQGVTQNEKMVNPSNCKKLDNGVSYIDEQDLDESTFEKEFKFNCRICLSGECDKTDPLISICNCSGTVKYIHINCAKELLKCKMKIRRSEYYVCLTWENMKCELCKEKLPDTIEVPVDMSNTMKDSYLSLHESTRLVNLIDTPEEILEFPYIVMECLNSAMLKKNTSKIIFFIKMMEEKVIIGRGQAAQVRLPDISISRQHTAIYLTEKNEFYLTDYQSKFGTLILQKEAIKMSSKPNKKYIIQSGRTLLTIRLKRVETGMCCWKTRAKNLQEGTNYFDDTHSYPKYFEIFIPKKEVLSPKTKRASMNEVSKDSLPPVYSPKKMGKIMDAPKTITAKKVNFISSNEESKSELELEILQKNKFNPMFKSDVPRLTELNNLSQPVHTGQDNDENNKTQKDYELEFRSYEMDGSARNNELEEEYKDIVMDTQNFEHFYGTKNMMSPSPVPNKPSDVFLANRGSYDINSFEISNPESPQNSLFFTSNRHPKEVILEQNEYSRQAAAFRQSTEFDSSFKALNPKNNESHQNQESNYTLRNNASEAEVKEFQH
ncbi:unnamed protein product [Moneuplotes crassus]|uniref:FHA domain-containing protein n=1 Tax=Euplotes crassus TaxID=5936 RepID=A0AAD1Y6S9_EUPCR|nr:unnamed protein product [Moneuplotes crassus]